MKAGDLDQRIEVRALVTVKDGFNADARSWPAAVPPRMVWAKPVEGKGREFVKGAAAPTQRLVAFQVRWASDINRDCRVFWQGWTFEIVDMTGTYRSGELWLHCQSVED